MKTRLLAISVLLLVLLVPVVTSATLHEGECHMPYLFNGYARATVEGAPTGAAFGLLVNLGAEEDTLISAETDAAEVVELHEMIIGDGDVMQMRPVEGGFVVGPHDFLELKPGGLHIMLINLKQPLEAGEMLDLLLHFEQAGDVALSLPILDIAVVDGAMSGGIEMEMTPGAMPGKTMKWGDCAGMHVVGAWARPAGPAMPNSAAYALLVNLTDKEDVLVSAEVSVSETVELHEMIMGEGDVMQMRPVEGGIPLPAGSAVQLKPGGLHVMLIGLKQELMAGTTMDLKLNFAESDSIELTLPIREAEDISVSMSGSSGG